MLIERLHTSSFSHRNQWLASDAFTLLETLCLVFGGWAACEGALLQFRPPLQLKSGRLKTNPGQRLFFTQILTPRKILNSCVMFSLAHILHIDVLVKRHKVKELLLLKRLENKQQRIHIVFSMFTRIFRLFHNRAARLYRQTTQRWTCTDVWPVPTFNRQRIQQ